MGMKRGSILIFLGCVLIAMGTLLSAYNLYEAYAAGNEVQQTLDALAILQEQPPRAQASAEPGARPVQQIAAYEAIAPVSAVPAETALPVFVPAEAAPPESEQTDVTAQEEAQTISGIVPEFIPESVYSPEAPVAAAPTDAPQQTAAPVIIPGGLSDEFEIPDYMLNPKMEMPVVRSNGQDYIGVLEIPSLGLELPIISEWNYARLKKAPCRYAGSAYLDNLVIAAHNYKTHFGRLKELSSGDPVIFTDAEGNRFEYAVVLKETLMPRDVSEMKSGEFDLSLFTCTVGGSYRVTVRCDRVR